MLKTIDLKTACEVLGVEFRTDQFDYLPEDMKTRRLKDFARDMIGEAINKETDFVPDYSEGNDQRKYWGIVYKDGSRRWVCNDYDYDFQFASCVPRLVFKDVKTMRHFIDVLIAQNLLD